MTHPIISNRGNHFLALGLQKLYKGMSIYHRKVISDGKQKGRKSSSEKGS